MAAHLGFTAQDRGEIPEVAREWLGARFRHQGRSDEGLDCAGLVIVVGRAIGALAPDLDVTAYARQPDGRTLLQRCADHLEPIAMNEISVGDVAAFRIETDPQHLAIIGEHPSGALSMIHAYAPSRKVVENRLDTVWRRRIVAGFRYRLPAAEAA